MLAVWLLAATGIVLIVAGWLLPWYVEPTAGGVGFSPMDAIVGFTGPGTVLIWVLAVAMLSLLVGLAYDLRATVRRRGDAFRYSLQRGGIAVAGAAATLLVVLLVGGLREEPLFGSLDRFAFAGNAVWMTLTGHLLCALAYGARDRVARHRRLVLPGVAFALGGAFPAIFNHSDEFVAWGARFAAIYVLLALGLNVVVGFAGLLDLGYAAFFAIGAYTTASLAGPKHGLHLPFWALIFLGAAVAALFGAILGAPTLRLRGDYLAIVTLGFGEIVPDLAVNNIGNLTGGPNGLQADPASFFGHDLGQLGTIPSSTKFYFWTLLALIGVVALALRNLERSRLGRAWMAIREDEVAAAATGINPVSTKLLAFAIGASVSGFAGAFFGAMLGSVTPESFGFAVSVTALSTVVLGGLGSIVGVIIGAVAIAMVINWVLPHIAEWSTTIGHTTGLPALANADFNRYAYVIYGLILVLVMLLRPGGLVPSRARKVELAAGGESESLASVRGTA